jgi:TonB family protein
MKKKRVHLTDALSTDEPHGGGDDSLIEIFGKSFEEKPIWAGLCESLHDAIFPHELPPLELTSAPIPTPDRMAVKTNPWAFGTATLANGGLLAMLFLMGLSSTVNHHPKSLSGSNIHLNDFSIFAPPMAHSAHGGGGGGANELTDPVTGRPPRRDNVPILSPQVPIIERPRLAVDPAIAVPLEIKLPDNPSLTNLGVQNSPNVISASNGPGTKTGIGTGSGAGVGPGKGAGTGPGFDHGVGDSIYTAGYGGVSNPIAVVSPDAEFSDEARRNKYQGVCIITVIVDAHGYPQNPRVIRSLGMGLDEKALESVQKYRFKPAMKDGRPVAARINVEVNFRFY